VPEVYGDQDFTNVPASHSPRIFNAVALVLARRLLIPYTRSPLPLFISIESPLNTQRLSLAIANDRQHPFASPPRTPAQQWWVADHKSFKDHAAPFQVCFASQSFDACEVGGHSMALTSV
jgi:hypothetical protein